MDLNEDLLSFEDFPLPAFVLEGNSKLSPINHEARKIYKKTEYLNLPELIGHRGVERLESERNELEVGETSNVFTLRLQGASDLIGKDLDSSWNLILKKISESKTVVIFMPAESAVEALMEANRKILIDKTNAEIEMAEAKALITALRGLFSALPQNTIQLDRFGKYSAIKDSDQLLFSSSEKRSGNFWEDLPEEISPEVWSLYRSSMKENCIKEKDIFWPMQNGDSRWIKLNCLYGKVHSFISYADVTDDKLQLAEMVREEQLSTVGVLAGGLAHQYNNLHHAVLALIHDAKQVSNEEAASFLNSAASLLEKGSDLSQSLLSQLRNTDNLSRGVSLKSIFKRVKLLVKDEMIYLNCKIEIEDNNLKVRCNPTEIDQILVNLILNAAHACYASDHQGVVKITGLKNEHDLIEIQVTDNGGGIPEKIQNRLFTPLFSTKGVYAERDSKLSSIKGTGLGLSLAKQLAEKNYGNLSLVKTSSAGSTFALTLPALTAEELSRFNADKKKTKESKQNEKKPKPKKKRILIIDDAKENRIILKTYLKDFAKKFQERENGLVDRDKILKFDPDVIFVDWLMPEYSGNDFLSALASDDELRGYLEKCIVLSGLDSSTEIESWRPKLKSVLHKPISQRRLIEEI